MKKLVYDNLAFENPVKQLFRVLQTGYAISTHVNWSLSKIIYLLILQAGRQLSSSLTSSLRQATKIRQHANTNKSR